MLADLGSLGESWFGRRLGQLRTGLSHAFRLQSAPVSRAAGNDSRPYDDNVHSGALASKAGQFAQRDGSLFGCGTTSCGMLPVLLSMLSLLRGDLLIWDDIRYHAIGASAGNFLSVNTSNFWHRCGCGRARATWYQGWDFDDWRYGARASWRTSRDSLGAFDIVKGSGIYCYHCGCF